MEALRNETLGGGSEGKRRVEISIPYIDMVLWTSFAKSISQDARWLRSSDRKSQHAYHRTCASPTIQNTVARFQNDRSQDESAIK